MIIVCFKERGGGFIQEREYHIHRQQNRGEPFTARLEGSEDEKAEAEGESQDRLGIFHVSQDLKIPG